MKTFFGLNKVLCNILMIFDIFIILAILSKSNLLAILSNILRLQHVGKKAAQRPCAFTLGVWRHRAPRRHKTSRLYDILRQPRGRTSIGNWFVWIQNCANLAARQSTGASEMCAQQISSFMFITLTVAIHLSQSLERSNRKSFRKTILSTWLPIERGYRGGFLANWSLPTDVHGPIATITIALNVMIMNNSVRTFGEALLKSLKRLTVTLIEAVTLIPVTNNISPRGSIWKHSCAPLPQRSFCHVLKPFHSVHPASSAQEAGGLPWRKPASMVSHGQTPEKRCGTYAVYIYIYIYFRFCLVFTFISKIVLVSRFLKFYWRSVKLFQFSNVFYWFKNKYQA